MKPMDLVLNARSTSRPTALFYINNIFPDFFELHGDRCFGDDPSIVAGIAHLRDKPVTVIGIEKGTNIKEKVFRQFGSPHPEGYRKTLRLMRQAEKFSRPIICFVDTAGAGCDIEAEERGQGHAIANNLFEMSTLKTSIFSVIIGEGGSGGALALAIADKIWMLNNAIYSVISPEGCASILWKNVDKASIAADKLKLTAEDMYKFGVVDEIIEEDNRSFEEVCSDLHDKLYDAICSPNPLYNPQSRYKRFRKF